MGNSVYSKHKFTEAADLYTRAIEMSPKPEAVYFSNRAACTPSAIYIYPILIRYIGYVNMTPPKHDLAVQDCDEALKMDVMYIKALNRRAGALEALGRFKESLRGMPYSPKNASWSMLVVCRLYCRHYIGKIPK